MLKDNCAFPFSFPDKSPGSWSTHKKTPAIAIKGVGSCLMNAGVTPFILRDKPAVFSGADYYKIGDG